MGTEGSESVVVTRRFNTVLEDAEPMGQRETKEGPYRAPVEPAKKGSVGLIDPRLSGSVSERLIQLGAQMQQFSMAVGDLQARTDVQREGRTVRHPVVATPTASRFQEDDDGIPDAWMGLSHKEALVSPSPVVQDRPRTRYGPSLAIAETLTPSNVGPTTSSTLVKQDSHGLDAPEREARAAQFPARRRSPEPTYGQGRRDIWDGPKDPIEWRGTLQERAWSSATMTAPG